MIKNAGLYEKFKRDFIKKDKLSYKKALEIYEGLWNEMKFLKIKRSKNPLNDLKSQINIAAVLNNKNL
jgi:hypothetical protein